MKRFLNLLAAIGILMISFAIPYAATANPILAGSVTVSVGVFSAMMHIWRKTSPQHMTGLAFSSAVVTIPDFTEKSPDEIKAMKKEEFQKYLEEKKRYDSAVMRKSIQDEIAQVMKDNGDSDRLKTLESKMNELIEENNHALLQVKELTEKMDTEKPVGIKSVLMAKKEELAAFLKKSEGKMTFEVEMKASQSPSDIGNREQLGQWLSGVGQIPSRRTYIKDRIRVVPTGSEYIKYMDQDTRVRDAKNVAHCGTTTHNTKLTWQQVDMRIKKVRDFVDVCIDMMDDYDFIEGEIRNLVDSSVQLKCDADLLLGDGTGENLNGIASYSSTFNPANPDANYAAQIQAATIIDLIVVAAAQISAFGEENSYMADTVYMNPKDYTLMKLLKDGEDNYIKQGEVDPRIFQDRNGRLWIDGTILVIQNPGVPQNEFYIFDSMRATIYQRKNAMVEFSYENRSNFETETVTVKVYERLNMLVRNVDANAFMHVPDIAGGVTAITKP